jgi:hypothetical protein
MQNLLEMFLGPWCCPGHYAAFFPFFLDEMKMELLFIAIIFFEM